jgi:phosphopantetheinyl transferase (holo-ACP synthase)
VGNDIVDLRDPDNAGKSGDSRFISRVLTVGEQERIAGAANPDQLLWAFWAAKEAAYKAVSRIDPAVHSIPRSYGVMLDDPLSVGAAEALSRPEIRLVGEVRTPRGGVSLWLFLNDEYVHALAAFGDHDLETVVHGVHRLEGAGDASDFGRRQLLREIGRLGNHPVDDLALDRGPADLDPPRVFLRGSPLSAEISLSHDGRFTAFALRLPLVNPSPEGAAPPGTRQSRRSKVPERAIGPLTQQNRINHIPTTTT